MDGAKDSSHLARKERIQTDGDAAPAPSTKPLAVVRAHLRGAEPQRQLRDEFLFVRGVLFHGIFVFLNALVEKCN